MKDTLSFDSQSSKCVCLCACVCMWEHWSGFKLCSLSGWLQDFCTLHSTAQPKCVFMCASMCFSCVFTCFMCVLCVSCVFSCVSCVFYVFSCVFHVCFHVFHMCFPCVSCLFSCVSYEIWHSDGPECKLPMWNTKSDDMNQIGFDSV